MRPWLRRAITVSAVGYPIALVVVILLLRVVGERWWVTSVALYLPGQGWGLPLPLLVGLLLWARQWRLLWSQAVALLVLVFGLMGFVLPWPVSATDGQRLRILSYNIDNVGAGVEPVVAEIDRFSPDVVVIVEVPYTDKSEMTLAMRQRYPTVVGSTQFLVASRYPIVETTYPAKLPYYGRLRSPRFVRHVLDTPLGKLALYVIHPISPRKSFHELRGEGLREELASGRLLEGTNGPAVQYNAGLRRLQVATAAAQASREMMPIVVAGDTNLPGNSQILDEYLGNLVDGFRAAGWGLGYTYPRKLPWMRIDRILAGGSLRFVDFQVGSSSASDHLCVVADLERAR